MLRRRLQRMRARAKSGSVLVEFAIIAPVFLAMFWAIIETGLVFFAQGVLENGVLSAARLIRTGQAQNQSMTQSQFRTQVCNQISMLLSCDATKLQLDVRSYTSFAGSTTFTNPVTAEGALDTTVSQFSPGGPCDIVVVRGFYIWQLFTPIFGNYFSNMANRQRMVATAFAFRNEPYGANAC
jgi:Flp pilus assembly protein TadG